MATKTQTFSPKPIIFHRSISLNVTETLPPPSSSSSPTSSEGPSVSDPTSDTHTLKSSTSLPNCSASSSSPSVTFAPLPTIEPRKRKSNVQLGVAARSRMLHQRRGTMNGGQRPSPMWTDLDEEAVNGRLAAAEDEDPFEVFGRYMLDKSKHLWRRVSQKGTIEKDDTSETGSGQSQRRNRREQRFLRDETKSDSLAIKGEPEPEGRVWEEEVGEGLPTQLARQTSVGAKDADEVKSKRSSVVTVMGKA